MEVTNNIHAACSAGDAAAVQQLLEAVPALAWERDLGRLPLHSAASHGHEAVVRLLLEAAPAAAMAASESGWLPLHWAAYSGRETVVRLLLEAAPQAATVAMAGGRTPLQLALHQLATVPAGGRTQLQIALDEGRTSTVRALLSAGPAASVLAALAAAHALALQLFPDFLLAPGRLPVAAADWAQVPSPCPGIERALPTALACGPDQAAQAVRRLPPAESERLRTAALCLGRHGLPGFLAALIVARSA